MSDYDSQEKFCNLHGWYRKSGILVNTEMINDDFDQQFFEEDMVSDFMKTNVNMWQHEDAEPEQVYDSVEEVIECIEDYSEITFKKWDALHATGDGGKK